MRILKWLGIGLGVVVLLLALVAVVARNSDEPIGPFPAGPMTSGEWAEGPVSDWSFARDVQEVHLELAEPASTRITWILVEDGAAFIPCGVPHFRLWKQWPHHALANGEAVVRIEGTRYPVTLVKDEDPDTLQAMAALLSEKYGTPEASSPDQVWLFRLVPRAGGAG